MMIRITYTDHDDEVSFPVLRNKLHGLRGIFAPVNRESAREKRLKAKAKTVDVEDTGEKWRLLRG